MDTSASHENEMELLSEEINQLIAKREVEKALEKIERLIILSTKQESAFFQGRAYSFKGLIYYGLNETKIALDCFQNSLKFYNEDVKKNYNEIIHISNSLGVIYRKLGELKNALNQYYSSVNLSEANGINNSTVYNNIAAIYL